MATTPYDIIAGPASVWVAPVAEAFVAVNVADPTSATNWKYLGLTQGGVKAKHTQTVDLIKADQRTGPVKAIRSEEGLELAFMLLEVTLENYNRVLNGTSAAGGVTTTGRVDVVTLTGFSGTDSFKITYGGVEDATAFTRGSTYTQGQLQTQLRTATGDATLAVSAVSDAGFTITFTAGFAGLSTSLFTITSVSGCTGTVAMTNPFQKSLKIYQNLDVTQYAMIIRGPSPYMNAYLQYNIPVVTQDDEPELDFLRDNNVVLACKFCALEDPSASTAYDRFGSIIAQTS